MEKNKWKLLAITFIALFTIQTISIIALYNIGNSIIENDQEYETCVYECLGFDENTHDIEIINDNCICYDEEYNIIKEIKT